MNVPLPMLRRGSALELPYFLAVGEVHRVSRVTSRYRVVWFHCIGSKKTRIFLGLWTHLAALAKSTAFLFESWWQLYSPVASA